MKDYKAAIYLRLSKEDKEKNNSIDAQREITTNYAKEHNYNIVQEYVDNGYSGILSSRPSLDKLFLDISMGKINMLIVKDMSRLTRDKNLTSYYTDIFFPDNDVRLISVTEYVDTGERYEIDDAVALRGIVNQSYLEDISRKIKAVKKNFKEQGKFIESSVAYGYKKDKSNKYKLEIDENVAPIIRKIYKSYLSGKKPSEIAKELNIHNVKTASQYLGLKKQGKYWTRSMVNRILTNPIYAGNLVLNKYENNIRLKKRMLTPKHNYKILENTHPGIISKKDYDIVQQMKGNKTKKDYKTYIYPLKELVYCKHCGRKMQYKNSSPVRMDNNGKIFGEENEKGYFICTEHYRHKEVCNVFNKIMEKDLNEIVFSKVSKRLKQLKIKQYSKNIEEHNENKVLELNKYKKIKSEISNQQANFKILYSKKVEGIINEEDFLNEYNIYKEKISHLKEELDKIEKEKTNFKDKNDIGKLIDKFENCENFDNSILKNIIKKIEVDKDHNIEITLKL